MSDSPLVIVNEHSRRFPRSLQEAFKVSEGYRIAVEGPDHRRSERAVDIACFVLAVAGLVALFYGPDIWAFFHPLRK